MKFLKKEDKKDNLITCNRTGKRLSISSTEKVDGIEITKQIVLDKFVQKTNKSG